MHITGLVRRNGTICSYLPKEMAPVGQTLAHIGFKPSEERSKHMSHFIWRCICVLYFGTPNGHAFTQLRQSKQRGFNADITTPSSDTFIASAGQTSAHVGSLQCMHSVGIVAVVSARSM